MRISISLFLFALVFTQLAATADEKEPTTMPSDVLNFTVKDIDGKEVNLEQYKGKVVLIVNVASRCGYTPQYAGLESVYEKYKDQGFVIIGFPANNFKSQEPGTDAEIKQFCSAKYNVTFPMMSKLSVKGDDQAPIYHYLTDASTSPFPGDITWNFNKFLIDRNGKIVSRFDKGVKPDATEVTSAIETALAQK